jgi:hypothetical protein
MAPRSLTIKHGDGVYRLNEGVASMNLEKALRRAVDNLGRAVQFPEEYYFHTAEVIDYLLRGGIRTSQIHEGREVA